MRGRLDDVFGEFTADNQNSRSSSSRRVPAGRWRELPICAERRRRHPAPGRRRAPTHAWVSRRCKTGRIAQAFRARDSASARPPSGSVAGPGRPAGRQHRWPHRVLIPHTTAPQPLGGVRGDAAVALIPYRPDLPMITFSFRPLSLGCVGKADRRIGQHASVRRTTPPTFTSVAATLVMPISGSPPATTRRPSPRTPRAVDQRQAKPVEPESMMVTRRSIWRTITSMSKIDDDLE